jgi:transcriptional regulator with XRE-family HTH domain
MLKRYRLAAGGTQEQLAERAGVCVRSISNLERGSPHVPRGDTIRIIVAALELPAEDGKAFMAAARGRDVVVLVSANAARDGAREVTAVYEVLRRMGGLLREIG